MNYQFLAMIVGFLTIIFTMITLNYQLGNDLNKKLDKVEEKLSAEIKATKTEIDRVEDKLSSEIKATNAKIEKVEERLLAEIDRVEDKLSAENKATNAKLDTFLLALFKGSIQLPKQNDKDAA